MTAALKPVAGIDHGTPPVEVLRQQQQVEALLKSNEKSEDGPFGGPSARVPSATSPGFYEAHSLSDNRVPPTVTSPESRKPTQRVKLHFMTGQGLPSFKLEFDVFEVCVKPNYISLWLANDLGFEPSTTMRFIMTYRQLDYPVIFAGAEFEFQTVSVRGISFLRDLESEKAIHD